MIQHKRNKFIVEEVFLVHKSGVLITHLSRSIQANVDDIIFSGMFTAVQEFIKDTFTTGEDQTGAGTTQGILDELKLGDDNILIEHNSRKNYALFNRLNATVKLFPNLHYVTRLGLEAYFQDNISYTTSIHNKNTNILVLSSAYIVCRQVSTRQDQ